MSASTDEDYFYDGDEPEPEAPAHPGSPATLELVLTEQAADMQAPMSVETPAERERTLRAPNFTRMPVAWHGEQAAMTQQISAVAQGKIMADFADLFAVVTEIEDAARRAGADPATGETGRPDYAALPERAKENWILELATSMVAWEQRAARYWGEAMMSKIVRQEVFTDGYRAATGRSTVEDRTQAGQYASLQETYFAVLCALLHKHAVAACSSAERLCQRLKDACAK